MLLNCSSCQATQSIAAMISISAGLRHGNVRAVVNRLLVKPLLSSSSSSSLLSAADYYSSAIALWENKESSSFTGRQRYPTYTSPAKAPLLDVSAGGGPRPKTPRVWKTKTKKGSVARSEKLIDVISKLSNTKEEVYGALDAWIAWDLEFPLIAVKKALKTLKDQEEWRRIIQVSKWMLDKGQGKTLATYQLLLEAFDHEGRIEEAEVVWRKLIQDNAECLPRTMFAQMIAMYDRYDNRKELLKVWMDMDELQVKPDPSTVKRVARAYSYFGYDEVAQALLERPTATTDVRFKKGKRVEVKIQPVESQQQATLK
ncbi:unnamed protein product [Calypogeia fissa]